MRITLITLMMVGLMGMTFDFISSSTMPTIERMTMPTSSWFHLRQKGQCVLTTGVTSNAACCRIIPKSCYANKTYFNETHLRKQSWITSQSVFVSSAFIVHRVLAIHSLQSDSSLVGQMLYGIVFLHLGKHFSSDLMELVSAANFLLQMCHSIWSNWMRPSFDVTTNAWTSWPWHDIMTPGVTLSMPVTAVSQHIWSHLLRSS